MIDQSNRITAQWRSPEKLVIKLALLLTSMPTVMAGATISPSLPAIEAAFDGMENIALLSRLVLTMPALFIVIGSPVAGYIVDTFGRKRLLIAAAILYGIAGGSGYIAETMTGLLVGRAFLGLAVAGVMTSVTTLIADYYTGPARAQFLGIQAAFMGLGGTVFLTLGGILADIDWRAPFLIYLISFLILPFIVFVLYEPERDPPPTHTDGAPSLERAPVRLMIFAYSIVVLLQIVFYLVPVQLPFYLQSLTGASASQSGMAVAAMTLFFATAAALFGWFDRRFNHITLVIAAFIVTGVSYIAIGQANGWLLVALGLPLGGFGLGLTMPNLSAWLANESPAHVRGRVLGGFTTSIFLGQFVSPLVSQPVSESVGLGSTYALFGLFLLVAGVVFAGFRHHLARFVTAPELAEKRLDLP